VIIDVNFQDDVAIPPAVMLQALRQLVFSLESNLKRKPNAPFISMGGSFQKGNCACWLHFHTDAPGQLQCQLIAEVASGLDDEPSGDRDE